MKHKNIINYFALSIISGILLSLPAFAQTNTVSLPAGFVRVVLPTNSEVLLSVPLDLLPDSDFNSAFLGQLTGSTNENSADFIRKWTPGSGFDTIYKADGFGDDRDGVWFDDFSTWTTSSLSILPGEGFFIGNRQSSTQTIFLCGFVLLDNNYATPLFSGTNLFGVPFSASYSLNDTTLFSSGAYAGNPATSGDRITGKDGINYWLLSDTNSQNNLKWVDTNGVVSTLLMNPGEGFWYRHRGTNPSFLVLSVSRLFATNLT